MCINHAHQELLEPPLQHPMAKDALAGSTFFVKPQSHAMSTGKMNVIMFDVDGQTDRKGSCEQIATPSWVVVALLGAYDEQLPVEYAKDISAYRHSIFKFCYTGKLDCSPWQPGCPSVTLI